MAEPPVGKPRTSPANPPDSDPAWLPRVLVVEDSMTRRTWIGDWLHEKGFTFRIARDGLQALELVESLPADGLPELVVSDVRMPNMGGKELARILKEKLATREVPVLLYTASLLDHSVYAEGARQQAEDQLQDAVDFDGLTLAIEQKVQHMRRMRELEAARRALRSSAPPAAPAKPDRDGTRSHSGLLPARRDRDREPR